MPTKRFAVKHWKMVLVLIAIGVRESEGTSGRDEKRADIFGPP